MEHRVLQQVRQFNNLSPLFLNLIPQCKQRPNNRLIQDASIQLLECAQAAQIFVAQSSHVQRPHDL
jgi:hypothetical protein